MNTDPFYKLDAEYERPRGIFYDTTPLPDGLIEQLIADGHGAVECNMALLCEFGESPIDWKQLLAKNGFTVESIVIPDQKRPPFDGIAHVIGTAALEKIIIYAQSSSLCAVRLLAEQADENLALLLKKVRPVRGSSSDPARRHLKS